MGEPTSDGSDKAYLKVAVVKALLEAGADPELEDGNGNTALLKAAATGLTAGQVQMTMTPFIRYTTRCIPRGSTGRAQITTSLTVGCNGRVISATVIDSGGLPPAVTQCIAATLKSAPFPAHDMPAGYVFQYPIHYSF